MYAYWNRDFALDPNGSGFASRADYLAAAKGARRLGATVFGGDAVGERPDELGRVIRMVPLRGEPLENLAEPLPEPARRSRCPGGGDAHRPRGAPAAPAEAGFFAFPQGSLAPEARAASDPRPLGGEWDKHSTTGPFFATKGGVACSPDPGPERQGRRSAIATGRTGIVPKGMAKALAKGGVALVARRNGPGRGPVGVRRLKNRGRSRPGAPRSGR